MTVTTEQRALWRRLAEEATPGEWTLIRSRSQAFDTVKVSEGRFVTVEGRSEAEANANAAFIAASREAVPALLEALDEAERADLRHQQEWRANYDRLRSERDALAAEVEERVAAGRDFAQASARVMNLGAERLAAAEREAERLRHGVPMEGDFVCPYSLRIDQAESDRDALALRVKGLEEAVAGFRNFGEGLAQPFGGRSRHVITAGKILMDMARAALSTPATPGATPTNRNEE